LLQPEEPSVVTDSLHSDVAIGKYLAATLPRFFSINCAQHCLLAPQVIGIDVHARFVVHAGELHHREAFCPGLSSASSAFSFVDICRHSSDLLCLLTIELWDMPAGQCRSALMTTAEDDSYGTREPSPRLVNDDWRRCARGTAKSSHCRSRDMICS
jgi:hypothetical protein